MNRTQLDGLVLDVCSTIQSMVKDGTAASSADVAESSYKERLASILSAAYDGATSSSAQDAIASIRQKCGDAGLI